MALISSVTIDRTATVSINIAISCPNGHGMASQSLVVSLSKHDKNMACYNSNFSV